MSTETRKHRDAILQLRKRLAAFKTALDDCARLCGAVMDASDKVEAAFVHGRGSVGQTLVGNPTSQDSAFCWGYRQSSVLEGSHQGLKKLIQDTLKRAAIGRCGGISIRPGHGSHREINTAT